MKWTWTSALMWGLAGYCSHSYRQYLDYPRLAHVCVLCWIRARSTINGDSWLLFFLNVTVQTLLTHGVRSGRQDASIGGNGQAWTKWIIWLFLIANVAPSLRSLSSGLEAQQRQRGSPTQHASLCHRKRGRSYLQLFCGAWLYKSDWKILFPSTIWYIHTWVCFHKPVQRLTESVEAFVQSLYKLAQNCEFRGTKD